MGLNQYLLTDQYFSTTWEKTGQQAEAIREICGIPSHLIHKTNATVRITLMEWFGCYWLDTFLRQDTGASDADEVLLDESLLKRFISCADKVLQVELNPSTGQPFNMHELFPYPDWWGEPPRSRPAVYDQDDLKLLALTRDRFRQILDDLPKVDLVYRISV